MIKEILRAIFNKVNLILVIIIILCFTLLTSCLEDNGFEYNCYCKEGEVQVNDWCKEVCNEII